MSLINKMLQDLESRKNPQAGAINTKSVYEDLKPLSRAPSSRAPSRRLVTVTALVAVFAAGAYAWTQWGDSFVSSLSSDKVAARPQPPVARKTIASKPKPAPVPEAAPVAVAAVQSVETQTSSATPTTPADKDANTSAKPEQTQVTPPAVTETKKTEMAPVSATPKKAASMKSKAAVARESGYWTVSPGETLYSISSQTGVDLGHLSSWNSLGREPVIHPGQRLRLTPPAKAETRQARTEKAVTPEKARTMVASAGATSIGEVQTTGNAVMDKKMKPVSSDEKSETEYRRAVDLLEQGRMTDAEKHLRLALSASETHTQARELLAGLMLQQGHWRDGQQLLEQGIDKVPAYYPFAQLLARIYVEHGAEQKALTVMEEGRRSAADNPDYVAFLAALYQRAGKNVEAVKTYNEAVTLNPQEGRSWLGLGISLEAMQDWNAAGAAYQRAIGSGTLDDKLLKYVRQRLAVVQNK